MLPNQYTSTAVVMLDQRKNNVTELSAVLSQLPTDPATLQNQIQIITSRELASEVVTKLHLYDDPEFAPKLVPDGPAGLLYFNFWFPSADGGNVTLIHDRIVANFLKHVSAEANGLSTAITIYAVARTPEKAQAIADAMAQSYVADQVNAKRNANLGTSDWLDKRTNDLAQQLMMEQQAVEQYKVQHGLNDSAPGSSLVDQQLSAINAQIVQARSDLAEKQAAADRVGASAQTGDADTVSQVIASPLIVQLRTQQAELMRQEADLATKYGPLHPKLQGVQAQERDLAAKIGQEAARIADSLKNDVEAAKTHVDSLQLSLLEAERQSNGQNQSKVALQALQSNADSTKAQYEAFVGRLRATEDQDTVAAPESRIISSATLPLEASSPKRWLIVGASIPLGLLIGILAALLQERFNFTCRCAPRATYMPPRPAPPSCGRRCAAPRSKRRPRFPRPGTDHRSWPNWPMPRKWAPRPMWWIIPAAAMPKPCRRWSANSILRKPARRGGCRHRRAKARSKSAVAVSLARAAAQMGRKTVLIDCDPSQLAMKAMDAHSQSGLYEVLTGSVPLSQALAKDSRSGVYALAMTRRPPKLATMFTSAAMTRLLQVLKEGADLVVMDCSRAAAPEAGLLAKLGDATLLVTRKDLLGKSGLAKSLAGFEWLRAAGDYRDEVSRQRGRSELPIRNSNSSTPRAHCRPSRIAHTTNDWPRRMSPQEKILGALVL